jgi:hypothetical protein
MPAYPFIAGLIAGAAAVMVLRGNRARGTVAEPVEREPEVADDLPADVEVDAMAQEPEAPKVERAAKAPKKRRTGTPRKARTPKAEA